MKGLLRSIAAGLIALLARGVLAKYRPTVVMITGSVGKTSTKDAVAAALSPKYHLRASEKSYNSEFGVPLTVIGADNPWADPVAWMKVVAEAFALILFPNHYPKLLVLEVGADRPGDLRKILSFVTPDAVVVTRLPDVPVHVEAYASPDAVREEEFAPAYMLPPGAPLIISADDRHATHLASRLNAKLITYGFAGNADVRLSEPRALIEEGTLAGMHATITHAGKHYEVAAKGALGRQQMQAPGAAFAAAIALGMDPDAALTGLSTYAPPPGRARILRGKSLSILIDDSYNASPAAAEEILASLHLAPAKRRIAVLGDMLELGRFSTKEHAKVGELAARSADVVIGVGGRSRAMTDAARFAGKSERDALHFPDAAAAAAALSDMVRPGDLVLIKGSQGIRMERITATLLAEPADSSLLVRQDKEWLKR